MIAIATNSGNVSSASLPSYNTGNGKQEKVAESTDSNKNAGQHTPGPYFGELRRVALTQETQNEARPAESKDPLGRGSRLDFRV